MSKDWNGLPDRTGPSRTDATFLQRKDDEHVSVFKQRDYACVIESQEIAAVVRYITALEAQIAAVAPAVDAQPVAGWQPIETAPEGKLLVVAWLDKDDPNNPERHSFDFIEEDGWVRHNEDYDHFLCVAPPGSRGPSADAPYTHWIELPEVPAALSKHTGEKDD